MPEHNLIDKTLDDWLESCTRNRKISRNTIAIGIVILDRLRTQSPLEKSDIVSSGGEIAGSRAGLYKLLVKYGLPESFLKEVTTRQAHQDGQRLLDSLEYGRVFNRLSKKDRDRKLLSAINKLQQKAHAWLSRQHLKIAWDRQNSPATWIHAILEGAKGKSGGKVEQHLVGAKLEQRHPDIHIPNHPGHAADAPTSRSGDFRIGDACYHVTANPTLSLLKKAASNLGGGLFPVILVPSSKVSKAKHLAEEQGIDARIGVFAIEDFVAQNIIEMSEGHQQSFVETMRSIIEKYNRRLEEVETDMALKIELQ